MPRVDVDSYSVETAPTVSPPPAWHLAVAYDGTEYLGWQTQPTSPTVQDTLTEHLRRLFCNNELRLSATSRTDSGVHALDQHASFASEGPVFIPPERVAIALNPRLPRDIRVTRCEHCDTQTYARFAPVAKAYVYTILRSAQNTPFDARFVWHLPEPLHLDAMRRAAEGLTGEHDFASFGVNPRREINGTVRTLHRLEVIDHPPFLSILVLGDRFLYKMVRSLIGFLVSVGRVPLDAKRRTRQVLTACDRSTAAETAPPQGLFLARVFFNAKEWETYSPPLPPHRAKC